MTRRGPPWVSSTQGLSGPPLRVVPGSLKHRVSKVITFCQDLKLYKQKIRIEGKGKKGWGEGEGMINKTQWVCWCTHIIEKGNCIISYALHVRFSCKPHTGSRYCLNTLMRKIRRTQEIYPIDSVLYDFWLIWYLLQHSCPKGSKKHLELWFSISFLTYGFLYKAKDTVSCCPQLS